MSQLEVDNTFTICTFLAGPHPLLSFPQANHHSSRTMVGKTSLGASSMDYTQDAAATDTVIATSESASGCIHSIIKKTNKRYLIRYPYCYLGYVALLFKVLDWLNSLMTPCCSVSVYLACPNRGPYPFPYHHLSTLMLAKCLWSSLPCVTTIYPYVFSNRAQSS